MKTKELIELLQKADPSGELHVRLRDGGAPFYVESLSGYYDGAYEYLTNNDEKMVITDKGRKVDIYSTSWKDWLWEKDGDISKIELDFESDIRRERWKVQLEQESKDIKSELNL